MTLLAACCQDSFIDIGFVSQVSGLVNRTCQLTFWVTYSTGALGHVLWFPVSAAGGCPGWTSLVSMRPVGIALRSGAAMSRITAIRRLPLQLTTGSGQTALSSSLLFFGAAWPELHPYFEAAASLADPVTVALARSCLHKLCSRLRTQVFRQALSPAASVALEACRICSDASQICSDRSSIASAKLASCCTKKRLASS